MIDVTLKLSAVQAARSNKYVHGTVTGAAPWKLDCKTTDKNAWFFFGGAAVTRAYRLLAGTTAYIRLDATCVPQKERAATHESGRPFRWTSVSALRRT